MRFDVREGLVRRGLAGFAAVVASLIIAAVAAAIVLSPTSVPLTGSTFQGGDGDQAISAALTDWESLASSPGLVAINDPNALDTAFGVGSHENSPLTWDAVLDPDGVTPTKANFLNAWAYVDHQASSSFLYLAFNREESGGAVFLAFELNQDTRSWTNQLGDQIICRTTGDIIVSYEIQNDDLINLIVQRWVTDTAVTAAEAAGGLTNGEGCAKTGHFETFEPPLADVQAAINAGLTIENFLPGGQEPTIGEELFGEAALDLTDIFADIGLNPCFSFGQISLHGRSSESDDASMQDLVGPEPFQVGSCTAEGVKYHDLDADGLRDAGEPGLEGFRIWADYDNDGVLDANEPFDDTNADGDYLIVDIVPPPPDETFSLRERLTSGAGTDGWICSEPTTTIANGPFQCAYVDIDASANPVVLGADFGNYKNATVIVEKQTNPNGTPGSFAFSSTIPGKAAFSLSDGQQNSTSVTPGVYTATEAVPAGWSLTDITCSGDTIPPNSSDAGNTATFNAQAGETITCVFTNTDDATVTIVKDAIPNDAQDFGFTGSFGAFSLDDDADGTLDNNTTFTVSAADLGQKTVTESAVAGWSLTGLECSEGNENVGTRTATLQVDAGDDITCTFMNTNAASLTIVKVTDPASDPQDFDFDLTGSGLPADLDLDTDAGNATLPSQQTFNLTPAQLGAHSVTESAVPGWTLTGLGCSGAGGDSSTSLGNRTATLDIDPGENVVCTFTNTRNASPTPQASLLNAATPGSAIDSSWARVGFAALLIGALSSLAVANARGVFRRS